MELNNYEALLALGLGATCADDLNDRGLKAEAVPGADPRDVLDEMLCYNGIIGYTDSILNWMAEIAKATGRDFNLKLD